MDYTIQDNGQNVKKIFINLSTKFVDPFLNKAAKRLAAKSTIAGFRPGQAPREIVEKKFGTMALLENAADDIITQSYYDVIQKEKLLVVGKPNIEIKKMVPGEIFEFTAEVSLLPEVNLGDITKLKVKTEKVEVNDKEIEEVLYDLRKMRAQEQKIDQVAKLGDKTIIDFTVKIDGVVIEGGQGKDYPLILGDKVFIPGFEEKLVGKKAQDKVSFKLKFPADYKVDLANKEADFFVEIKEVYERILPEINNDLLQALGNYKDINELKEQIKQNLLLDKQQKADQKFEVDLFEQLIDLSTFSDIPELLIDNELHRMKHELADSLQSQNLSLQDYLQRLGKKEDDLKKEWRPAAIKRVKTALVARKFAEENKISANQAEIDQEIAIMEKNYQLQPEIIKNINSKDFRDYLFHTLTNRKVISFLKEKISN